eukprot:TRINITY_DN2453_c0_g1_i1.p1 TRINITY_DN2453_c0_g1~~TRINITY_DN2453_c0_g1_i1.p1  ORF type:complete len:910 (+),score=182.88 TRINITY_DN2453_c0_g1_i1:36-2732(+)
MTRGGRVVGVVGSVFLFLFLADAVTAQPGDFWVPSSTRGRFVSTKEYCRGTVVMKTLTGVFGETGGYGNNADCRWIIDPPGARAVKLSFDDWGETESGHDFLEVYRNGDDGKYWLVKRMSGTNHRGVVFETGSRGEKLLVRFVSDKTTTKRGWMARYVATQLLTTPDIVSVDGLEKKNHQTCNTDMYRPLSSPERLITRRGRIVEVLVYFKDPFERPRDRVEFYLTLQDTLADEKIRVPYISPHNPEKWGTRIKGYTSQYARMEINIPVWASVGTFDLWARLRRNGKTISWYRYKKPFDVLFNPYETRDDVYVSSNSRKEWVERESGFVMTSNPSTPRPWNFDQFNALSHQVTMRLLRGLSLGARQNPVHVSRHLSAEGNVNDGSGILHGRWDGKYSSGIRPTAWTGSGDILNHYHQNGYQGVKYGQCWVFSGLLTTLLRGVGIPCLSVTTYNCAHEQPPYNQHIENYWKWQGNRMIRDESVKKGGSVWNFHVFNEAYMKRNSEMSNGWQVLDATPQEVSEDTENAGHRLGPAPIKAIRARAKQYLYDVDFALSMVDADIVDYVRQPSSSTFTLYERDKNRVGSSIVTARPHEYRASNAAMDVTHYYKDSPSSAAAFLAEETDSFSRSDFSLTLKIPDDNTIQVGSSFPVTIEVVSLVDEERKAHMTMEGEMVRYTNEGTGKFFLQSTEVIVLPPMGSRTLSVQVEACNYALMLQEGGGMQVTLVVEDKEHNQIVATSERMVLQSPSLVLELPAEAEIGSVVVARVLLENPLPLPLSNIAVHTALSGTSTTLESSAALEKGETLDINVLFQTSTPGLHQVAVTFISDELDDIFASGEIRVTGEPSVEVECHTPAVLRMACDEHDHQHPNPQILARKVHGSGHCSAPASPVYTSQTNQM